MSPVATALLIFLLRIGDVSVGTVRVLYTVRGQRVVSMVLGFIESLIWIFAISQLVTSVRESPWNMVAWAVGFSAGTAVGITLEQWIASGSILVRLISVYHSNELRELLRDMGFGVTTIEGEGKDGSILILFAVAPRKRNKELLRAVQKVDPDAFITVEPVSHAYGGYPPDSASPTSLKK